MQPLNRYILMLEDDADDRHITETFFAENNYGVHLEFLTNSDDVLPFLEDCSNSKKQFPSLILLDKNVPATGGIEVLRSLKLHPSYKIIPVVMISGTAFPGEVNDCYRYGANSFIIKPSSNELTAKKIQNFLNYWFTSVDLPETAHIMEDSIM